MAIYTIWVATNVCGSKVSNVVEIDDEGMTESELETEVLDIIADLGMYEWGFKRKD